MELTEWELRYLISKVENDIRKTDIDRDDYIRLNRLLEILEREVITKLKTF